ncbi:hypothetical protein P421_10450 [Heyndrickxia coagulans P38]|nr:hypothetical protein P421_10450 [Heyndrickxia coagulans P38]
MSNNEYVFRKFCLEFLQQIGYNTKKMQMIFFCRMFKNGPAWNFKKESFFISICQYFIIK